MTSLHALAVLAGAPALARVRAVETYAAFGGDAVDFTVVGIDASRAYPSPLLRTLGW